MNPLTIETLPPEISETLESALMLPSNESMRKGSNKNFFTKWFKNRQAGGKTEQVSLDRAVKATRRIGRLTAMKEESSERESLVMTPPVQIFETESPQTYLDRLLTSRGYSTNRHDSSSCGYFNKPTAFQIASFDVNLVNLVRNRRLNEIEAMLKAGISANPCSKEGESLIHMIARRGDTEMLNLFKKYGCRFEVADMLGRNLLHDAFWASQPAFDTVELLLREDIDMIFMNDSRQNPPLACARKEHWKEWIEFFEKKKDIFWPQRSPNSVRPQSALLRSPANSCPIANPKHALTTELAQLVVCGTMEPEEALLLRHENLDDVEETEREISERVFTATMLNLTERSFDMNDMDDILATLAGPTKAELETLHELEIEPIQEVPMAKMSQSNHTRMHELLSESSEEDSDSDEDSDSEYSSDDDIMDADEMNELLAGLATMPPLSPQRQIKPPPSEPIVVQTSPQPLVSKLSKRSSMGTAVTDPSTENCDEDESSSGSEDDSEYDSEYSESEDYSEIMADMPVYVR
ncbi:hypothetical protein FisN_3Lh082 [Fistulifera solaris]|uniref:Uncharacterized protein n=1 Tax=Fistulifera solaris TaxID=1519565 RepID=A0A1Z5JYP5_FISSO|nr:hypothetical protein FisN_3Lh082 [Fistulifera solaris]|eukprot:GAX19140.1 hypothetical protein FisN_3Lh082 [Fistulifera solaris]